MQGDPGPEAPPPGLQANLTPPFAPLPAAPMGLGPRATGQLTPCRDEDITHTHAVPPITRQAGQSHPALSSGAHWILDWGIQGQTLPSITCHKISIDQFPMLPLVILSQCRVEGRPWATRPSSPTHTLTRSRSPPAPASLQASGVGRCSAGQGCDL